MLDRLPSLFGAPKWVTALLIVIILIVVIVLLASSSGKQGMDNVTMMGPLADAKKMMMKTSARRP